MAQSPNIILCMTDDQGWGDTAYNGHPILKTPNLDRMAAEGLRLDRFYAAAPVCSPTRGSCLTGRHPYRYGIFFANVGHLLAEEFCIADVLKQRGYLTGHFGKWHVGTLTRDIRDGRRGGRPEHDEHYAPPWDRYFDECFSTESAIPTWNPTDEPAKRGRYWTGPGEWVGENIAGDDSRVIMDRAEPFIERAVERGKPFFAVVWFHAPHEPVRAGDEHRAMYPDQSEDKQHYYGCITAMDEQVGRLRATLERLGVAENTLMTFNSDNGPAGEGGGCAQHPGARQQGSAGPYRGRKGSLYEGGVRVPGIITWPGHIDPGTTTDVACTSCDYFTTILDILGYELPKEKERPYDGTSLLPLFGGELAERPRPIGFQSQKQRALTDNRYKIYQADGESPFELYDLVDDPTESDDIAGSHPEVVATMKAQLEKWQASCAASLDGCDYGAA